MYSLINLPYIHSYKGIVVAIYNVGTHYFAGKGVKHSFEKAANYFQQAADLGFTPAQVNSLTTIKFYLYYIH